MQGPRAFIDGDPVAHAFLALPAPAAVTDAAGHIVVSNEAWEQFFGVTPKRSRRLRMVLPLVDGQPEREGEFQVWRGAVLDAYGRTRHVDVRRSVLDAECQRSIWLVNDVSVYVAAVNHRKAMLYDIAHELSNPAMVAESALELLSDKQALRDVAASGRLVRRAAGGIKRLTGLLDSLLSAASIESGQLQVSPKPTPLHEIVEEAVEAVADQFAKRGQRLCERSIRRDLVVLADPMFIVQVLVNLLSNASKYGPRGGMMDVQAGTAGSSVWVAVRDRGPGIPANSQEGLFSRFFRGLEPGNPNGHGLGLAIARGIVEAHGGNIGVESARGAGTRVWFTLPSYPARDLSQSSAASAG